MAKIHEQMRKEGGAAAGKAEKNIKKAITKPIKSGKETHPGGRRPGDKK